MPLILTQIDYTVDDRSCRVRVKKVEAPVGRPQDYSTVPTYMVDLEGKEVYAGRASVTYTTTSDTNKGGSDDDGGDELAIIQDGEVVDKTIIAINDDEEKEVVFSNINPNATITFRLTAWDDVIKAINQTLASLQQTNIPAATPTQKLANYIVTYNKNTGLIKFIITPNLDSNCTWFRFHLRKTADSTSDLLKNSAAADSSGQVWKQSKQGEKVKFEFIVSNPSDVNKFYAANVYQSETKGYKQGIYAGFLGAYYFPQSASDDSISPNLPSDTPSNTEPEDVSTAKFVAAVTRSPAENSTDYQDNFSITIAPLKALELGHQYSITIKEKNKNKAEADLWSTTEEINNSTIIEEVTPFRLLNSNSEDGKAIIHQNTYYLVTVTDKGISLGTQEIIAPGIELRMGSFIVPKDTKYSTGFAVEVKPYLKDNANSGCPWYHIIIEKENDEVGLYTKSVWASLPFTINDGVKIYNYSSKVKVFFNHLAAETRYYISVYQSEKPNIIYGLHAGQLEPDSEDTSSAIIPNSGKPYINTLSVLSREEEAIAGYPLILDSISPVHTIKDNLDLTYHLSAGTSDADVQHLEIKVMRLSNNRLLGNSPDGIIYKEVKQNELGAVTISAEKDLITQAWEPGALYKIQIRYGSVPLEEPWNYDAEQVKAWRDHNLLSEWSNVLVVKYITGFNAVIQEFAEGDSASALHIFSQYTPTFTGIVTPLSAADKEPVTQCKFDLYDDNENLLETSDWIVGNGNDPYRFNYMFEDYTIYQIQYSYKTLNGFEGSSAKSSFEIIINELEEQLEGVSLIATSKEEEFNRESGTIRLYLNGETDFTGSYVLSRASEEDNFRRYTDLQVYNWYQQKKVEELIFTDYTVESGVLYRYAFQKLDESGLRTSSIFSDLVEINLEYAYLYRDGIQLKLELDNKMNSFKHTVQRTKQDTLGGRYPKFLANGYTYYAEFPVTGLISFQADEQQTFISQRPDGIYAGTKLIAPARKFEQPWLEQRVLDNIVAETDDNRFAIDYSLGHNNYFVERRFREAVESWLNDFNYKLFRSCSEGNIPVMLMNISMTPNETLGRLIYSFTATAYEAFEPTLENYFTYGIQTKTKAVSLTELAGTMEDFGQFVVSESGTNVYQAISDIIAQTTVLDGKYKESLTGLTYLSIEQAADARGPYSITVNGTTITQPEGRKYVVTDKVTSLIANTAGLIINYKCEKELVLTEEAKVIDSMITTVQFGQIILNNSISDIVELIKEQINKDSELEKEELGRIIYLAITDTDPTAQITINEAETYIVGETCQFILDNPPITITSLAIDKPAIINFKATKITTKYQKVG